MKTTPSIPPALLRDDRVTEELAAVWTLVDDASPLRATAAPDPERIRTMAAVLATRCRRLRLVKRRWYVAAAACMVFLIFVAAELVYLSRPVELTGSVDQALPDGSTVTLTEASHLLYHRRFGRTHRQLSMEGVAFFDVQSGEIPFVVETSYLMVTVTGTRFSVDTQEGGSTVIVTEGTVEVLANQTRHHLSAGDGIRVTADSVALLTGEDELYPDLFIHIKQPLGVMFDAVETTFGVKVMADEAIRQHVHNFKHEVTTVEALINDLCRSVTGMKLQYRATATGFEILAR